MRHIFNVICAIQVDKISFTDYQVNFSCLIMLSTRNILFTNKVCIHRMFLQERYLNILD